MCVHVTAGNFNGTASATGPAANTCAAIYSNCGHITTVDGDVGGVVVYRTLVPAANACAKLNGGCSHFAAINNDVPSGSISAAADTCAHIPTGGVHGTAVDSDASTVLLSVSPDARLIFIAHGNKCACAVAAGLGIDGQAVIFCHINAAIFCVQSAVIC